MRRSPVASEALRFDFAADEGPGASVLDTELPRAAASPGSPAHSPEVPHVLEDGPQSEAPKEAACLEPGAEAISALSVAGFYERLQRALRREFSDEIWVTGEIRKVTVSKGHRYIELADHIGDSASQTPPVGQAPRRFSGSAGRAGVNSASLEVCCWAREWPAIASSLDAAGVNLTPGLVIRVRGRVSVWEAGARVRFSMSDLDVEALLGGIAAARRRLIESLREEGLLEANQRLVIPTVPLRIGLVASRDTEGHRDFAGQLERSGFAFVTRLEHCLVQGAEAPMAVANAIGRLQGQDVDLIVIVRGGGAKGDLAAFDHELVARAIATSRHPIWTGIGHTGDRAVADEVANRALVTPTACGEAVVNAVLGFVTTLENRARTLAELGARAMDGSARSLAFVRSELSRSARYELRRAEASVAVQQDALGRSAHSALARCQSATGRRATALSSCVKHGLVAAGHGIDHRRTALRGYDPKILLTRGYSLTRTSTGSIVRSIEDVVTGDGLTTSLVDGTVFSTVRTVQGTRTEP